MYIAADNLAGFQESLVSDKICLIKLLPLLVGHYVPEGDETCETLCLKDVVELALAFMGP